MYFTVLPNTALTLLVSLLLNLSVIFFSVAGIPGLQFMRVTLQPLKDFNYPVHLDHLAQFAYRPLLWKNTGKIKSLGVHMTLKGQYLVSDLPDISVALMKCQVALM